MQTYAAVRNVSTGRQVPDRQTAVQRVCNFDSDEDPLTHSASNDLVPDRFPPIIGEIGTSAGKPLDLGSKHRFDAAFGWNFAGVRIHDDQRAADAARSINARAYTTGNHVVFGAGQFAPGSAAGDRLLAHELAHVIQQAQGPVHPGVSRRSDPSEQDADRMGEDALAQPGSWLQSPIAQPTRPPCSNTTLALQRWPGDGMVAPGDCNWATYFVLRAAVEAAKALVDALGACRAGDTCATLAGKIAAIAAEITARVALDTTCFRGGNTGHREQVQIKVNMLNNCYEFFVAKNCLAELAAEAAAAAAAAEEAAAADAATTAEIEEAAAATGELVEGAVGRRRGCRGRGDGGRGPRSPRDLGAMRSFTDVFGSSECPPPDEFLTEAASGADAERLRGLLATTAPADLTADDVRSSIQGNLWMLSPRGFRCLLPTFMQLGLDHYGSLGIFVAELVLAFTKPERADVDKALDQVAKIPKSMGLDPDTLRQLRRQQLEWHDSGQPAAAYHARTEALSASERDAVLQFLTALRDAHGPDFPRHELDIAIERHQAQGS